MDEQKEKEEVMDYPLYDIVLGDGEDNGMFRVSIVNSPAIQEGFVYFSEEKETQKIALASEEKMQVIAPLLIPDMPILRKNDEYGYYYVKFSEETIKDIMYKYSRDGFFNQFNLEHEYETDAVTMLEIWMKETDMDKSDSYGFDLPIGTLFMKAQIESEELWSAIKDNEFNGFSIEIKAELRKLNNEQMSELKLGELLGEYKAKVDAELKSVRDDQDTLVELAQEAFAGVEDLRKAVEMIQEHIKSMEAMGEKEEEEENYSEDAELSEEVAEEAAPEEVAVEAETEEVAVEEAQTEEAVELSEEVAPEAAEEELFSDQGEPEVEQEAPARFISRTEGNFSSKIDEVLSKYLGR